MVTPTVHHLLQAARPRELLATDIAAAAGLSIEDTYAELVRLEALHAVDMRPVWPNRTIGFSA